ncbi:hypothetical protein FRX31_013654 [Thalictrum thalictroides]|uniref:Defensin-like protein n=1 Tax=Thalictrum thalictroides TaxID=46969 RepID=A0A7J6WHC2_THATH|nr:hypothetical protein FRX31_013654 [Thalictrum thalictroides]
MAKLSFTHFFIFALIVVSAVTVLPQAEACKTTIWNINCDPLACEETCTHTYKGNGACTNVGGPHPVCVCEHPC